MQGPFRDFGDMLVPRFGNYGGHEASILNNSSRIRGIFTSGQRGFSKNYANTFLVFWGREKFWGRGKWGFLGLSRKSLRLANVMGIACVFHFSRWISRLANIIGAAFGVNGAGWGVQCGFLQRERHDVSTRDASWIEDDVPD